MVRNMGTTSNGLAFGQSKVDAVWAKGTPVTGYDPNQYRKDYCGAWIARSECGLTTEHGWEIDHIYPVARNGSDDLANLQPLHWRNNRGKGDDYPNWICTVKAQ